MLQEIRSSTTASVKLSLCTAVEHKVNAINLIPYTNKIEFGQDGCSAADTTPYVISNMFKHDGCPINAYLKPFVDNKKKANELGYVVPFWAVAKTNDTAKQTVSIAFKKYENLSIPVLTNKSKLANEEELLIYVPAQSRVGTKRGADVGGDSSSGPFAKKGKAAGGPGAGQKGKGKGRKATAGKS